MAEFVVTPFFEPEKNRVKTQFGVLLNNAEDGDVARVPNLLGKIRCIKYKLRLKEGVLFSSC